MSEILLVPAVVIAVNIVALIGIVAYFAYHGIKGQVNH